MADSGAERQRRHVQRLIEKAQQSQTDWYAEWIETDYKLECTKARLDAAQHRIAQLEGIIDSYNIPREVGELHAEIADMSLRLGAAIDKRNMLEGDLRAAKKRLEKAREKLRMQQD
jgi:DNA repair ATPase RecN